MPQTRLESGRHVPHDFEETEFLIRLCKGAGCGLLLDVTNVYVNGRNGGDDPVAWLRRLDPAHARQLHVVGYSYRHGRWEDDHAADVQPDLRAFPARGPVCLHTGSGDDRA